MDMQKFLLLRNNKQTGPYSVEELEQMGLKPYDLIWVNGKSAAWRYPGEIDDLKSFAPAVEEQPYDRFYKRPNEETQKKNEVAKTEAVKETTLQANGTLNIPVNGNGNSNGNGSPLGTNPPPSNPPSKKAKEYKRVFVTLPNAASLKKAEAPVQQNQEETLAVVPPKIIEAVPTIPEKQKPVKIESYQSEDMRNSSMDIYYTRRKGAYLRKSFLIGAFAIGIVSLIGLGMFIGLALQQPPKEAGKQETEKVYRVSDNESKVPPVGTRHTETADNTNHNLQSIMHTPDSAAKETIAKKPKGQHTPAVKVQLKDIQQKAGVKSIDSSLQIATVKPETEKRVAEKRAPNLAKYVSVSNNDFQVGPFGGISHLEMTVHNSSEYDLDLVVVDLEYLKVNKEVYKTETLYFKDVNANSSVTVTAPKSSRGNKINYKVSLISSKDRLFHSSSE